MINSNIIVIEIFVSRYILLKDYISNPETRNNFKNILYRESLKNRRLADTKKQIVKGVMTETPNI